MNRLIVFEDHKGRAGHILVGKPEWDIVGPRAFAIIPDIPEIGPLEPVSPFLVAKLLLGELKVIESREAPEYGIGFYALTDEVKGYYWWRRDKLGEIGRYAVRAPIDPKEPGPYGAGTYERENISILGGYWIAPKDPEQPARVYSDGFDAVQGWALDIKYEPYTWRLITAQHESLR